MISSTKTSKRLARLLRLVVLLQNEEFCSVESLRGGLGVSRRTFFRDLKCLEEAGYPAYFQRGYGYEIRTWPTLQPDSLTAKEVLGLMMLGKIALCHAEQPMVEHGLAALFRSVNAASEEVREACKDLMSCIDVQPDADPIDPSVKKHFLTLLRVIDEGRDCSVDMSGIEYVHTASFHFAPHSLVLEHRGWTASGKSVPRGTSLKIRLTDITNIRTKDN